METHSELARLERELIRALNNFNFAANDWGANGALERGRWQIEVRRLRAERDALREPRGHQAASK